MMFYFSRVEIIIGYKIKVISHLTVWINQNIIILYFRYNIVIIIIDVIQGQAPQNHTN